MRYEFNGKNIVIPDNELNKLMSSLDISQDEAIDLWLCDNGYDEDEEQEELDEKASKVKILKEIDKKSPKKERKPVVRVVSDEKRELFKAIYGHLDEIFGEDVEILTENKLISVKINGKSFKIDIIEQRKPKNK